jgi:CubicO group peptidase (beta-lactamase class C family)
MQHVWQKSGLIGNAGTRLLLAAGLATALLFHGTNGLQAQALELAEAHVANDYSSPIEASRALILEIMENQGVPGASVAVGIGGEIVWSEGFGWANIELGPGDLLC